MAELSELVPHIWLDFQQMAEFEKHPVIVVEGDGIRVRTADGRELIDGIAGAVVNGLGYRNERVQRAMKEQIDRLLWWPVLHSTTEPALRLAAKLAQLLPGDLDRAFLLSGGSEATECAMKMARQYHLQTGHPEKYKVIGRHWGYHGSTKGALSASGVADKKKFLPFLEGYIHALLPYCYRCPFGETDPDTCARQCVEQIEWMIRMEGRETVSAVIVDPVMGAAGVLVPPRDYYQRLREICDRNDVLLIFDEVMTGFGRLGEWFACQYYDVVPRGAPAGLRRRPGGHRGARTAGSHRPCPGDGRADGGRPGGDGHAFRLHRRRPGGGDDLGGGVRPGPGHQGAVRPEGSAGPEGGPGRVRRAEPDPEGVPARGPALAGAGGDGGGYRRDRDAVREGSAERHRTVNRGSRGRMGKEREAATPASDRRSFGPRAAPGTGPSPGR